VAGFYLGPNRPRLRAETWDDIVTAADSGILGESHWVELKKDIPKTAPNGDPNLELAKDLASLSVDGGVLIVGSETRRSRLWVHRSPARSIGSRRWQQGGYPRRCKL
jgi:hypothetical protein